jgi:uncharacterized protein
MAKFFPVEWLFHWLLEMPAFEFEWDKGNVSKSLLKHDVNPQETEEVFLGRMAVALGEQIEPVVNEQRLCIVGPSWKDRLLSVIFTIREGRVRPISTRPANRKEKKIYEKIRKVSQGIRKH